MSKNKVSFAGAVIHQPKKTIVVTKEGEVFVEHGDTKTKIDIDPKVAILICATTTLPSTPDQYADRLLQLQEISHE